MKKIFFNNNSQIVLFFVIFVFFLLIKVGIFESIKFLIFSSFLFLNLFALNLYYKDFSRSAVTLLLSILIVSFCSDNFQSFLIFFSVIISLISCLLKKNIYSEISNLSKNIIIIKWYDKIFWLITALFILTLFYNDDQKFIAYDLLHLTYSLSIGNSFELFSNNDFSFYGKKIYYNFLAEKLPILFSNISKIHILNSLYLYSKLFGLFFLIISTSIFLKKITFINIPLIVLFFFPIYILDFNFFNYDHFFNRTVGFTHSYLLATSLLIFGLIFILNNNKPFLFIVMLMLILIKAQYFLVLFGTAFIYWFIFSKFKKIFYLIIIILPIFSFIYLFFLKNAAQEAHWIIFPQILYERIPSILFFDDLKFNFIKFLFLIYPLFILFISVSYILSKNKKNELAILSSLVISGFIGYFFLTEPVALSSRHFYNASSFGSIIIFFHYFSNKELNFKIINNKIFLNLKFFLKLTFMFVSLVMFITYISKNFLIQSKFAKNLIIDEAKLLSKNEIITYDWIKENINNGTILNFNHYVKPHHDFIKSALISKQIYLESSNYKGITMNIDFAKNFSKQIYIYDNFVIKNKNSYDLLNDFKINKYNIYESSYYNNSFSVEKDSKFKGKIIYYLGFKKNYSLLNISKKLNEEINSELDYLYKLNLDKELWFRNFLNENNIKAILLEEHDLPGKIIKKYTSSVYSNDEFTVLEVIKQ